jgi:hypothetical protein
MSFRVLGLDPEPFRHLFGLSDAELERHGARRLTVDAQPGFPDRVEVRDASPGDTVILQPAATPYRASHAIFIREFASARCDLTDTIPSALMLRTISLRAFDDRHEMVDADLVEGSQMAALVEQFLANPAVAYLHAHYAKQGCYAARIERA